MTAAELMELTFEQKSSELDQYKTIRDLTDNNDLLLLRILLKSVNDFINTKRDYVIMECEVREKFEKLDRIRRETSNFFIQIEDISLTQSENQALLDYTFGVVEYKLATLKDLKLLIESMIKEKSVQAVLGQNQLNIMVEEAMKPFSGYWNNTKLMKEDDYKYLLDSAIFLVKYGELPSEIHKINCKHLSAKFISYTFYTLFNKVNRSSNKKLRDTWVLFIHSMFERFDSHAINTIYKNFSKMPDSYEMDRSKITY